MHWRFFYITCCFQAVHFSAMRENSCCTLRVLEVILNLVELLMDMGVLKQFLRDEALSEHPTSAAMSDASPGKGSKNIGGAASKIASEADKPKPVTPHRLIMHIIVR